MTAEKEKPNDDDFETIRIYGCWRRHVWVTSVRDWWRLRPTFEKYHQLKVANNTLSLKKSILGVRFLVTGTEICFKQSSMNGRKVHLKMSERFRWKFLIFEVSLKLSLLNHQTTKFKFLYFDWKCSVFAKSKLGKLRFELEPNQCS